MSPLRTILAVAFPAFLLSGCPNPEGDYNDFVDRYTQLHPSSGGAGGAGGSEDAGPCTVPKPGELDGDYLFVLSAHIAPGSELKPLTFALHVTSASAPYDGGTTTAMTWKLQPLQYSDRKTPVGDPIEVKDIAIAPDGSIDSPLGDVAVTGAANPISKGINILATIDSIDGRFCNTGGFYCGTVTGKVTKPFPFDLAGSTWTMTKAATPADYPEPPPIDCQKDLATPVGQI